MSNIAPDGADQGLDWAEAQRVLADAMLGADDGELYFEDGRSEHLGWDDGRLKGAGYSAGAGFGVRVVQGERTGYAHSCNLSRSALRRAAGVAAQAKKGREATLELSPVRANRLIYRNVDPLEGYDFETKTSFLGEIDAYVRKRHPEAVRVEIGLNADRRAITLLRPDGERFEDMRPMAQLGISVTLERNGRRETGFAKIGGRHDYAPFFEPERWQALADEACRVAGVNLSAIAAPTGEMDVVLGPGWPGVMIHEAVGHGLEGDFNRKGLSAYSGQIGERVAAPGVTIVDNGAIDDRRGSLTIDDEGTPTRRTVLIEDGILKTYMQDRLNARLMGMSPTGNGRRQSYQHRPMPRMTNTYMENGDRDPAEIIASLKRGLYAVNMAGGQVDITNGKFVFQCTEAYLVEDGKIVAPVKNATLIGDGPRAMRGVEMIGNDFALDPGVGDCGKDGQNVPAGIGQPTVKIAGLTVGGAGA
ncbi:metallopeptidase TldD-related protein [Sphingomonas sp.]|uniref:TldD/PmbA family protein n=1 Tax=Sphingomonas sp. TaxID=28214 RepID=UPI0025DEB78A|nr:metallopeptidase TldD-related protein [Sphingomonas sp.]